MAAINSQRLVAISPPTLASVLNTRPLFGTTHAPRELTPHFATIEIDARHGTVETRILSAGQTS
jgi:hypothetical protein